MITKEFKIINKLLLIEVNMGGRYKTVRNRQKYETNRVIFENDQTPTGMTVTITDYYVYNEGNYYYPKRPEYCSYRMICESNDKKLKVILRRFNRNTYLNSTTENRYAMPDYLATKFSIIYEKGNFTLLQEYILFNKLTYHKKD